MWRAHGLQLQPGQRVTRTEIPWRGSQIRETVETLNISLSPSTDLCTQEEKRDTTREHTLTL